MEIKINESELIEASNEGVDEFLAVFIDKYKEVTKGEVTADTMAQLNGYQNTLLAFELFRDQISEGGFVQLIQNGYGGYIFDNPFAKSMRVFGASKLSKLIYKAKEVYDANKKNLEKETTEEEFYSMYVDFEIFDEMEEEFFEIEEESTNVVAHYVDDHLDQFATIVK
jgi:hypothetical protein